GGVLSVVRAFTYAGGSVDMRGGRALGREHSMGVLDYSPADDGAGQIPGPSIRARNGSVDSHDVGLDLCDGVGRRLSGTGRAANGDRSRSGVCGSRHWVVAAAEMARWRRREGSRTSGAGS